ncbi:MAG: hypothetical protein HY815_04490 [Candidatus Riflebacteria bacterium]|nr:hypothetical protein [Candidatus Riflebacteria bacterium]
MPCDPETSTSLDPAGRPVAAGSAGRRAAPRLAAGLTAVLVALCVGAGVMAQNPSPVSTLLDPFDPDDALARIAKKLFAPSASATLVVTPVARMERFSEGCRYDTYEVRAGAKALGQFVRIQVFPDTESRIDFAIRLDQDRIVACEPLRPVILKGKEFKALPALFAALKDRPAPSYAGGLASIFHSAALLEEGSKGPRPLGASPAPLISVSQLRIAIGDPLPDFRLNALSGRVVTRDQLVGRPAVIVFAQVQDGLSQDALVFAKRETDRHPGVQFLAVLGNTALEVKQLQYTFGESPEVYPWAALDPDGSVRRAFRARVLPTVHVFDRQGKLAATTLFMGKEALAKEIAKADARKQKR